MGKDARQHGRDGEPRPFNIVHKRADAYSGELDFGELTYVYSLSTRKIAPVDGEYAGAKEYGIMCGGYPQAFIFIDK